MSLTKHLNPVISLLRRPNGVSIQELITHMELSAGDCRAVLIKVIADGGDVEVSRKTTKGKPIYKLRD
jgi:hypothetical protein